MSAAVASRRPAARSAAPRNRPKPPPAEPKILFQQFFKSVGPRTYAAQVKEAGNGNHFVVLTESKRTKGEDEPRKTRLFVFSEDFVEFFKLVQATAHFIKANPVSDEVRDRQKRYWQRQANGIRRSAAAGKDEPDHPQRRSQVQSSR